MTPSSTASRPAWKTALPVALLVGAALAAYAGCLQGTPLWDDRLEIFGNPLVTGPGGWWRAWVSPTGLDYLPLKDSVHWLGWAIWGPAVLGYHLLSVALHVTSGLLLWRLLRALGVGLGWVGGLLFVVHPLAVESVAWMAELKNTLSLPLALVSFLAFVHYTDHGRRFSLMVSLVAFVAALLCKTSVVGLPVCLLAYRIWRRRSLNGSDFKATALFFLAASILGVVAVNFQTTRAIQGDPTAVLLPFRILQAGGAILVYVRLCLWPVGLAPAYAPLSPWLGLLGWGLMAGALGVFWTFRGGWGGTALFGTFCFVVLLAPALGIVYIAYLRVAPVADHFAYLALACAAGLAAAVFDLGWRKAKQRGRAALSGVAAAVIVALGLDAQGYAAHFANGEALWSYGAAKAPGSWLAHSNYGQALLQRGDYAQAVSELTMAADGPPDSAEVQANLGAAYEGLGETFAALPAYRKAVRLDPKFAGGHYDLGRIELRLENFSEAAAEFEAALALNPAYAAAHNNLGLVLARQGKISAAAMQFEQALRDDPGLAEAALNQANLLARQGQLAEAVPLYRHALAINPGYRAAHANLAAVLQALGRGEEAASERRLAEGAR